MPPIVWGYFKRDALSILQVWWVWWQELWRAIPVVRCTTAASVTTVNDKFDSLTSTPEWTDWKPIRHHWIHHRWVIYSTYQGLCFFEQDPSSKLASEAGHICVSLTPAWKFSPCSLVFRSTVQLACVLAEIPTTFIHLCKHCVLEIWYNKENTIFWCRQISFEVETGIEII